MVFIFLTHMYVFHQIFIFLTKHRKNYFFFWLQEKFQDPDVIPIEEEETLKKIYNTKENIIGPHHPVSNLRVIKFKIEPNESPLQKKLRHYRQDTQDFHHQFWTQHNTEFVEAREKFVKNLLQERYPNEKNKRTISISEMSEFYKSFLDSKWKSHLNYNLEWQRRNFTILFLGFFVGIQKKFFPKQ